MSSQYGTEQVYKQVKNVKPMSADLHEASAGEHERFPMSAYLIHVFEEHSLNSSSSHAKMTTS